MAKDGITFIHINRRRSGSPLNTSWWNNNTRHFGLQRVTSHQRIKWGDVTHKVDSDCMTFIEYDNTQKINIHNVRWLLSVIQFLFPNTVLVHVQLIYNIYASPFYSITNAIVLPTKLHPGLSDVRLDKRWSKHLDKIMSSQQQQYDYKELQKHIHMSNIDN